MLGITSFLLRSKFAPEALRVREEPRKEQPERAPSLCYEVLIPYTDAVESGVKGLPADARHSIVVNVWATSATMAQTYARERFRDHRVRARSARIAAEGPIPLRVVRAD